MRHVFALLMMVFMLPQFAFSQYEDTEFADPNQPKIDSLLNAIKPDSPDNVKAINYCEIAQIASSLDTLLKYVNLSLEYCEETDTMTLATDYYTIGQYHYMNCEPRKALSYFFKSADLYNQLSNKLQTAKVYIYIGNCYYDINSNTDSVLYYNNLALRNYEEIKDTNGICYTYQQLGDVYNGLSLNTSAKEYFRKALHYATLSKDTLEIAFSEFCLGSAILQESDTLFRPAIELLKHSVLLFEAEPSDDIHYINGKQEAIFCLAEAYIVAAKFTGEKEYADSSYMCYKKIGNYNLLNGEISNYVRVQYIYVDYLIFYKKYNAAIVELIRLGKYLSDDFPAADLMDYNKYLYNVYSLLGDYKNALKHYEKFVEYNEKLLNDNTFNSLKNAEVENVRQMEALKRESAEKLHTAEKQRMHIVISSLVFGLALVLVVIGLIIRVLILKKRANTELLEKNSILIEQKEEIRAQRDEIEGQKEEIMAQRDHIKLQNKEIQSSITYARRIQRALLTPEESIANVFPDFFVLYKPRDVVSGDFYWVGQFGDNKVCIVADCTGHGVPGGFMSMLGMTNLNYIVGQDVEPDVILNKLREAVVSSLRQSNNEEDDMTAHVLDGMDVAAYVVNERQMTLTFAGANNPLVLIRDNEIQLLKPDKMPVGISVVMNPFKSVTMELHKGDCLYTFSDGFQDQFGYESDRKFQKSRLRNLLLEIHQQPMDEQRELLNTTFKEWRGPAENQTDDVVILGVRI